MGFIIPANKISFWDAFDIIGRGSYGDSWSGLEIKSHNIYPLMKKHLKDIVEPVYNCIYSNNSKVLRSKKSELDKHLCGLIENFPDDRAKEKEFWIGDCELEGCIRYISVYKAMMGWHASGELTFTLMQDVTAIEIEIEKQSGVLGISIDLKGRSSITFKGTPLEIEKEKIGKLEQRSGLLVVSRENVQKICLQLFHTGNNTKTTSDNDKLSKYSPNKLKIIETELESYLQKAGVSESRDVILGKIKSSLAIQGVEARAGQLKSAWANIAPKDRKRRGRKPSN